MSNHVLAGLAAMSFVWLASPAIGQTPEEADDGAEIIDLIEVVAERGYRATNASSATGLSATIDELPINIPVITADVVADFQLLSQRDALQFHAAADDKRVRGFNTGEFFRNGFLHLSDTHGFTIERIEVIRGPSAVLNGPVTPGGAVNVISKKALVDESFGEVGAYWGFSSGRDNRGFNADFNLGELSVGGDGPTGAFRFVGGFQEDTGFGTRANNESHSILPTLELHLTDDTRLGLEYYQYAINTDRTDRPMGIELTIPGPTPGEEIPLALAYDVDPRQSWFYDDTDIEESLDDWSVNLAHQFTPDVLGQVRYYRHSRDFVFGPGNRPRIDIFYRMVNVADGNNCSSSVAADCQLRRLTERLSLTNDIDQATASLAWTPDWGSGSHQIVGGVHVYDQNARLTIQRPRLSGETGGFYFEFFDPANVANDDLSFNRNRDDVFFVTVLDRLENIEQNNVFLTYHGSLLDERLNLLLGLTNSDIRIERADPRIAPLAFTTIADNSELLVQAGFVYSFTDAFAAYANYSESQLPDVNDPDFSTAPPVRIGEQAEFGFKLSLFDNRVDATVAYFQIDEELSGETTRSAEATGWEIDASWQPNDAVSVIFSYAHADTEVTASTGSSTVGDPLVDEVPNKAAVWSVYNFDGPGEGLSIGGGFVWTDERVRPTAAAAQAVKKLDGQVLRFDAETRLDLFAKYALEHWEFSLNLRNLTEEVNLSNNVPRVPLQGGVKADGSPYVFDGDMEVMLGVRYRY